MRTSRDQPIRARAQLGIRRRRSKLVRTPNLKNSQHTDEHYLAGDSNSLGLVLGERDSTSRIDGDLLGFGSYLPHQLIAFGRVLRHGFDLLDQLCHTPRRENPKTSPMRRLPFNDSQLGPRFLRPPFGRNLDTPLLVNLHPEGGVKEFFDWRRVRHAYEGPTY